LGEGDPESTRALQEAVAQGLEPSDRGPKPLLPAPGGETDAADAADAASGADVGAGPKSASASMATGFEPDPAQRVGARRGGSEFGVRLGPATKEDIWMWQDVPPGCGLIRTYKPGERRYYMGDNAGPSLKELPPAWPTGQGPDA
jgi:hypothetical protein